MAATSVNKLVDRFENPTIPPIDDKPTYATIHGMNKLLNSNAASGSTNLSYVTLGYLCLTHSPTVYSTLLKSWVFPYPNPRATPVILSGTTRTEAVSIRYNHDAAMLALNTFWNVDRALCQKLMGAVKENFVQVKHRPE